MLKLVVRGDRDRDFHDHIARYAELGIREYFIADVPRGCIQAWSLAHPTARAYTSVPSVGRRYRSEVLRLDVALENDKVRFYDGERRLLDQDERIETLRDALHRKQAARRDAEQRAADAAAELARMRELIERLQRGG